MDRHDQILRRPRDFTLLEALIATTLIGVLTAAFYSFLFNQANTAFEEGSEQDMQTDLRRTMGAIISQLENGMLVYLDTNGAFVRYQVPQAGTTGTIVVDNNGNPVFGAYDTGGTWYPNGYYELSFLDSNRAEDYLVESQLKINLTDNGQNLNQDYTNGTTTQDYTDAFVFGQFAVQTYSAAGNVNSATFRDALGQVGAVRTLPGQCLRQYDKTNVTTVPPNTPPPTWPDNGGFFYLRQAQGALVYNSTGGTSGTLVWGPQRSEPFTDANGNGVWDTGETFTDSNGNGIYEDADSEPFIDLDGNNVLSGNEKYTDVNGNGRYDAKLRVILRAFDARRIRVRSDDQRMQFSSIRILQTKIKIRNGGQ